MVLAMLNKKFETRNVNQNRKWNNWKWLFQVFRQCIFSYALSKIADDWVVITPRLSQKIGNHCYTKSCSRSPPIAYQRPTKLLCDQNLSCFCIITCFEPWTLLFFSSFMNATSCPALRPLFCIDSKYQSYISSIILPIIDLVQVLSLSNQHFSLCDCVPVMFIFVQDPNKPIAWLSARVISEPRHSADYCRDSTVSNNSSADKQSEKLFDCMTATTLMLRLFARVLSVVPLLVVLYRCLSTSV